MHERDRESQAGATGTVPSVPSATVQSDAIDPFSPRSDLHFRQTSVRGGSHTMLAQGVKYGVDVVAIMVFARLLQPEDFGLIAMVTAVVGFLAIFKDAGLTFATVQREEIHEAQVSGLFWINVSVGVLLAGGAAAVSPRVAGFFGDPRLVGLTWALAGSLALAGLEAQHAALLRRQMRFGTVATIQTVSQLVGTAAGLGAAFAGLGVWSLVVRTLATAALSWIATWIALPWRPLAPWHARDVGPLLRFGGWVSAFGAFNHVGRNLDNVLIGRFFGGAALGLYTKAYALLLLPVQMINTPVSAVAIPALSRLRANPEHALRYYYRALAMVASLAMPVVTFLAAVSDSFVLTLLGPQWSDAAGLFRILAIPAFIGTLNVATGWVFLSEGRVRQQFVAGVANTLVGSAAIVIGLQWGVVGVAWALAISALIRRPPTIWYCYRGTPYRVSGLLTAVWRPACAAGVSGALAAIAHALLAAELPAPVVLVIAGPLFALSYLAALYTLPGGRAWVGDWLGNLRWLRSSPAQVAA
ncbi:MAG: lipopolysaccharide biosynthesis protein [Myxococcota bacterium]